MRRLIAAAVVVVGVVSVDHALAQTDCSSRKHSSRTASAYSDQYTHRVGVWAWRPDNGGSYYATAGPWRGGGYASPKTLPSGHSVVSHWCER